MTNLESGRTERVLLGLQYADSAHGMQYDEQCKALVEAGLSVVRYDLLGCGASLKPRAASMAERLAVYSPAEAYKDLVGILEQFTEYKVWPQERCPA